MRKHGRALVILLAATTVLAGCLGAVDDETGPTGDGDEELHWSQRATEDTHDHTDPAAHRDITTPNFEIVGHSPLIGEYYGRTNAGNLCGDARQVGEDRKLAAVESREDIAFTVADVSDPANPEWLGEFAMPTTYVYDLTLLPDGEHVALVTSGTQQPDQLPEPGLDPTPSARPAGLAGAQADGQPEPLMYRSGCASGGWDAWHALERTDLSQPGPETVPHPASLILVSIEDPADPEIVDERPITTFGHSINATIVDGRQIVIASTLTCLPQAGCPHPAATFDFYGLVETPQGAKLEMLSRWTPPAEANPDRPYKQMGHNDAWVGTHPVTGQRLAYLVAWDAGLFILDIQDPRDPQLVGNWSEFDPANPGEESGNTHSAFPAPHTIEGRHYTVIGPENGGPPSDTPAGEIRVLDTTDPAQPTEAAAWVLPHETTWEGAFMWSPHYLSIQNHTAFVSHYHAGIWSLDLTDIDETWTELDATGVLLPTRTSPQPPETPFRWTPTQEEVLPIGDGALATFDSNSGLYTFTFDEAVETEPAPAWGLQPAHPGRAGASG